METEKTTCKLKDIQCKPDHYFNIDEKGNLIKESENWCHEDEYFCQGCGTEFGNSVGEALEHVGIELDPNN